MLRPAPHIRYHIAAILAAHWIQFVAQYKRWIRPVVFENVRKVLAGRTPVLGCHIYQCKDCGHVELIVHSCKSRFCCTFCGHTWSIPRHRILRFEKSFDIKKGQPFVWECRACHDGVVIPGIYKNIHGEIMKACS